MCFFLFVNGHDSKEELFSNPVQKSNAVTISNSLSFTLMLASRLYVSYSTQVQLKCYLWRSSCRWTFFFFNHTTIRSDNMKKYVHFEVLVKYFPFSFINCFTSLVLIKVISPSMIFITVENFRCHSIPPTCPIVTFMLSQSAPNMDLWGTQGIWWQNLAVYFKST